MSRLYLSAPLPFVGQKRMFAREFIKVLQMFPDGATFVDLFGGSGLLSHITKHCKPHSKVIYNDFDNYRQRIDNIPRTNHLIADIRNMVGDTVPRHKPITGDLRERIFRCITEEQKSGFVDFITLSSSVMFSMKYRLDVPSMRKEALYNNIRKCDYPECQDYLDGLDIVSCDYKQLVAKYRDDPAVVFLADPPYLATEVGTYHMHWTMADYLDVLKVLEGHSYVYFTSNKSSIVELCEWMGRNPNLGNPFKDAERREFRQHMNYSSSYTDMMLFKKNTV